MTILTDSWYPVTVEGCFQAVCTEYNAASVTEAVQGADIIIVALGQYFYVFHDMTSQGSSLLLRSTVGMTHLFGKGL